ncbi:MAG: hypothetical protein ACJKTH_01400 [Patescibacteria group bacterium UBA2163]
MNRHEKKHYIPKDREGPMSETWNCGHCDTWGIPITESRCPECGWSRVSK